MRFDGSSNDQCSRRILGVLLMMVVSVLVGFHAGEAKADEAAAANVKKAEKATVVLRGILQEREKFKSGVAVVRGTLIRNSLGKKLRGPVVGLYAFELDGNKLRYDNAEPQYTRSVNAVTMNKLQLAKGADEIKKILNDIQPTLVRLRLCYIRNRDYSAYWTLDGPSARSNVDIMKPDKGIGRPAIIHHLHDVRAVGLLDFDLFEYNVQLKQVIEGFLSPAVKNVIEEKDQVVLEWKDTRLVVETRDGFRPIELTQSSDGTRNVAKTRWERRGKIDVPVEMTVLRDKPGAKSYIEYTLKYDWKSVNDPVDPVYFDYHSFQNIRPDLHVNVRDHRGSVILNLGEWAEKDVLPLSHDKEAATPPAAGSAVPAPAARK